MMVEYVFGGLYNKDCQLFIQSYLLWRSGFTKRGNCFDHKGPCQSYWHTAVYRGVCWTSVPNCKICVTEISFYPLPPPPPLLLVALVLLLVVPLCVDASKPLSTFDTGAAAVDIPLLAGSPALGKVALGGPANSIPPCRIVVLIIFGWCNLFF